MKSCYRLKKNYQYNYVYKHAQSVSDRDFVLLFCKSNKKQTLAGFSVSKKYGHAVERNRLRRQMKAAASVFMPRVKCGYNIVFVPRKHEPYQYGKILASFEKLLSKAGLL